MADPALKKDGQSHFAAVLLNAELDIPAGMISPDGKPATKRFSVYRNNVAVSLVSALEEVFPTVRNLVGEEFFRAMARIYIEKNPPRSPLLFLYGQNFADFIETFEPARELGFLPDVARLERLWLDAFHAGDATPLNGQALSEIPPERLSEVRFTTHPAMRLFKGNHAAVTIVARDRQGEPLAGLDAYQSEDGLITRPEYDPQLRHLPLGGHAFFETLACGKILSEAAETALAAHPDFDISGAIAAALQSGAFTAISLNGEEVD